MIKINQKHFLMLYLYVIVIGLIFLTGCADPLNIDACRTPEVYGFWSGLWHGTVAPISFLGRLLDDNIAIYAVNNNGRWYDFEFVLGSGILGFGAGKKS